MWLGADHPVDAANLDERATAVWSGRELAVVVPTLNERANIPVLIERLHDVLDGTDWEVVFGDDDSRDDTAELVRAIAQRDPRVRCVQRIGRRGLSSACIEGILATSAPIVAVAIDLEATSELNDELRTTTERMLATLPSARLACVNVLKQARLSVDTTLDEQGHNKHIDRLVRLKDWAEPLKLAENRLTVHAIEAIDPAAAILEFAEVNRVDHILIGARQNTLMRKLLGGVSAKVAAEASCTVTVVRARS